MDQDGRKYWTCKNGHRLGHIVQMHVSRKVGKTSVRYHTSQLVIYREALTADDSREPVIAGALIGRMMLGFRWVCSVPGCGCTRDWHPDDEALQWLKTRMETPPPTPPHRESADGEGRKEEGA